MTRNRPAIGRGPVASVVAVPLMLIGAAQADQHLPSENQGAGQADQHLPAEEQGAAQADRHLPSENQMDPSGATAGSYSADETISNWPETPRNVAQQMIEKYGEPDGITDMMLVWNDNGPWERTIVYKEEIEHNFPVPHTDVLEQFIEYEVPEESFTDLANFDGSVVAYRTNGELSARCDKEAANFLALNLANDVIEGNRTVDEARAEYAQAVEQLMAGENPEYVQALQFTVQTANTADPDQEYDADEGATMASSQRQAGSAMTGSGEQQQSVAAMSVSELRGMTVLTADGEVLGEIERISTKANGDRVAVVEVGGILGIGSDDIELNLAELDRTDDDQLKSRLTRDRLSSMPESE